MRPIEILLALWLGGSLLLLGQRATPARRRLALALLGALILLALHASREGVRWQMTPLYALIPLLAVALFVPGVRPTLRRRWLLGSATVALLLGVALALALPVPALPRPQGPYAVGTFSFPLRDESRAELYSPDPNDRREIMVQIWYPAAPDAVAPRAPWIEQPTRFIPAVAELIGLPPFALSHFALIQSNALARAAPRPSATPYPVVLYSHGWTGFRAINSHQMESLASHGFVAVGMDHSYGAVMTVFPDGRIAPNNPAALPSGVSDEAYHRASNQLVRTFAGDLRFVLDTLAAINQGARLPQLAGLLDLSRVGLFGHSTGGGAVVLACQQDPRCQAGLAFDAWVEPLDDADIERGLAQPFLFVRSEPWIGSPNDQRLTRLLDQSSGERLRLGLPRTTHRDFTLQALMSPLTELLGLTGPRSEEEIYPLLDAYLVAFFSHTLKGEPAPLLTDDAPPFDPIRIDRYPAR